jgi:hypothetical protein
MSTKSQPEAKTTTLPDLFAEMQSKALDAIATFAQANQRVAQELVEFSAAAAKESVRAYAELQSAALDAARDAQATTADQKERGEEARQDPFAWYQKNLLAAVDGSQKTFRLFETNAQILTRSAERLQASAQRTGKEIQEALTTYLTRVKDFSGRN